MLSVIMLSVVMLNVLMLSVVAPWGVVWIFRYVYLFNIFEFKMGVRVYDWEREWTEGKRNGRREKETKIIVIERA
jgi:hypothetical protein